MGLNISMLYHRFGLLIEWLAFFIFLFLAIYTLRVIKKEKKSYLKNAVKTPFHHFTLMLPHWWGKTSESNENLLIYKRFDTYYEWEARFHWMLLPTPIDTIASIEEFITQKINERHILFDEENFISHNSNSLSPHCKLSAEKFQILRIEGTATQEAEHRIYYDAFIAYEQGTNHLLFAESKSSILNGLLEGPYFEEVMKGLVYHNNDLNN